MSVIVAGSVAQADSNEMLYGNQQHYQNWQWDGSCILSLVLELLATPAMSSYSKFAAHLLAITDRFAWGQFEKTGPGWQTRMDPDEIDVELPIPPSPLNAGGDVGTLTFQDTVSSSEKPLTPQRTYSEPLRINIVKKEKEAREIPKENVKQTSPSVQGRASTRSPATSEPARSPSRQKREEQADEASDTQLSDNDEVSVEMPLIVETKPRARAAPAAPAQRPLAQVPIEVPKKEPPSWTRQIAPAQCVLQRSSVQKSYDPDEVDVEIDVVTSPNLPAWTRQAVPARSPPKPPQPSRIRQAVPAKSPPKPPQPSRTRQAIPAKSPPKPPQPSRSRQTAPAKSPPEPPRPTPPMRAAVDPDEVDVEIDAEISSPEAKASVESIREISVSVVRHRKVYGQASLECETKAFKLRLTRGKNSKEVVEVKEEDEESDEDSDTD
ncbi:hypothetical protein ANCCEY_01103 [Ancylostoma ceylanicum]|uniref:Uncharacterized protein n=1 Tax=Ancylostoma ceylanicum TaxID=53326 RepID=A0A0D6M6E8_9BILA|nr:hypothetical protein ANCCEY_01103 [Ancylostoma ceylanicum]